MSEQAMAPAAPPTLDDLRDALRRAREGDAGALPLVRLAFDQDPERVGRLGGDLAREADRALVEAATGEDLMFREALTRKLEQLRADLAGPAPAPIERLLAERAVACWLQAHHADMLHTQAMARPSASARWLEHLGRRQDRAHRRYLSALRTLVVVRKLAAPGPTPVQVIVGQQQVIAGGGGRLSR